MADEYPIGPVVGFEWVEEEGEELLLFTIEDFIEEEGYQVFLGEETAIELYNLLKRKFEKLIN